MSKKLTGAQKPFTVLVAHIRGGSDPSKGTAGNPVKVRTAMTMQHFVEVPGRGPKGVDQGTTPGTATRLGHVQYTTDTLPVNATGTITVGTAALAGPTTVLLGNYVLTSGEDFAVVQATATATVVAFPSTATLTVGGTALTDAGGARTPGSDDYDGTLGSAALIAADIVAAINDAANSFAAIATASDAGGGAITLTAVSLGGPGDAVTLTTSDAGDITVSGATFDGSVDGTATNLAAAISFPGYSATSVDDVVTVTGPVGPEGNYALFRAGGSSPYVFTLSPDNGSMSGAEPALGPIVSV
jgi:hypothetical protein